MSPVVFLLASWGTLDVAFLAWVWLVGSRGARRRATAPGAPAGRLYHLVVGETSAPAPQR